MPSLFIIAGCNGAGKTTASFTILPDLLNIREFVNADEIARGLSPFQPEKVDIEAGKIMLRRIKTLINQRQDFAFETTLASRSFTKLITDSKVIGYSIYLIFLWLDSPELAFERVYQRVTEGGHNIPKETIFRRYKSGIYNFIHLYQELLDYWIFIDNSKTQQEVIAEGQGLIDINILNQKKWATILDYAKN